MLLPYSKLQKYSNFPLAICYLANLAKCLIINKIRYYFYYFRLWLVVAAALAFFACFSQDIAAAGFGVSPSSMEFVVEKGSEVSRQLIIYNTGKAAEFEAKSSNPGLIKVYPDKATISGYESKKLTVTAFGKKSGAVDGHIVISVTPQAQGDSDISLSLGTSVAVKLLVAELAAGSANFMVGSFLSASIVIAGILIYLPIRNRARQSLHT